MRKVKFSAVLISLIIAVCSINVSAVSFTPDVDITAEAVYMINIDDNSSYDTINDSSVVYAKNQNELYSPGYLAKLMTAILVMDYFNGDMDAMSSTVISAPSDAFDDLYQRNAPTADFRINEEVSYKDLMYGMLLQSSCEAANIIAYNMGEKDIAKFVKMMNEKAKELGCTNTNFTNPHGLMPNNDIEDTQKTSARDIAIMYNYLRKYDSFTEIASTYSYELGTTNKHSSTRMIYNINRMVSSKSSYYYQYTISGVASNYKNAGFSLVSIAEKNGIRYLIVSFNSAQTDSEGNATYMNMIDHTKLYKWAFSSLSYTTILAEGEEVDELKVLYGNDSSHVILKSNEELSMLWPSNINVDTIIKEKYYENEVIAPVKKGQVLGKMDLSINGQLIKTVDLVAAKDVERDNLSYKIEVAKNFNGSNMFKIACYICLAIFVLYTIFYLVLVAKRNKKRRSRYTSRRPRKLR